MACWWWISFRSGYEGEEDHGLFFFLGQAEEERGGRKGRKDGKGKGDNISYVRIRVGPNEYAVRCGARTGLGLISFSFISFQKVEALPRN